MVTKNKNFMDQIVPSIKDTVYEDCQFAFRIPNEKTGRKIGVPLLIDGVRRIYIRCNLCNREVDPNAIVIDCLTVIKEFNVDAGSGKLKDIIYGRYDPDNNTYDYKVIPEDLIRGQSGG